MDDEVIVYKKDDKTVSAPIVFNPHTNHEEVNGVPLEEIKATADWYKVY